MRNEPINARGDPLSKNNQVAMTRRDSYRGPGVWSALAGDAPLADPLDDALADPSEAVARARKHALEAAGQPAAPDAEPTMHQVSNTRNCK